MKRMIAAVLASATLAVSAPAMAQTASYNFSTTVAEDGNRMFAGSFSVSKNANVYTLTSFAASYNGFQYNLTNVGATPFGAGILIGATANGVMTAASGMEDFYLYTYTNTNTSLNYALARAGYTGFIQGSVAITPAVAAVPEPATWVMMMIGFGAMGFALRRRQKVTTRIRFA